MSRQDQSVEAGGAAIQAARDVIVHGGISPTQMGEIMAAMSKQFVMFQNEACKIVDERMETLHAKIIERFSQPSGVNPEAFRDPDFQYLLNDAHEAVARSGDEAVRDTLVDIIARRSLETTGSRLAITLNDAAKRTANLTADEFATLSLVYLIRYTVDNSVTTPALLFDYVENKLLPFATKVSREQSSYSHIQAQSCGLIEISSADVEERLKSTYGGVLGKGFDRQALENNFVQDRWAAFDPLLIPCLRDKTKLQPAALNLDTLKERAANAGVTEQEAAQLWSIFASTADDVKQFITASVPAARDLFEVWMSTPLHRLSLTTTGIAIGHANAVRTVGFDAELNVWIK